MSDTVMRVENLGKKYTLGPQHNGDLRQSLAQTVKRVFARGRVNREDFWAIKDLNLDIKRGSVVGIIGRNGAGKSTLLKILSRITDPTTGRFEINGRVSSLLEVGTGFHMELTGRENIFLNGTILGMRRQEIKTKLDEIIAFSGVENFLDTPVKHYSSGMRVRLAFSVAAHLEPEILIIDEVLAVGDAEFQNKCLGKMDEVSKREGRTILFVSHNMAAVERLCTSAVLLCNGNVLSQGLVGDVINSYLSDQHDVAEPMAPREGVSVKQFLLDTDVHCMSDVSYEITLASRQINRFTELAILIYNQYQERIGIIDLRHNDLERISSLKNEVTVKGRIERIPLIEGSYQLGLFVSSNLFRGDILGLKRLVVNSRGSRYVPYAVRHRGYVELEHDFTIY